MRSGIILLFFCLLSVSLESKPLDVDVSASSAILLNAKNGKVLYEKDAHTKKNPASTTKIATAIYLLERKKNLEEMTVATQDCIGVVSPEVRRAPKGGHPSYRLETRGTTAWVKAGEKNTLRTLLYGLMMQSGNDAANIIALHVSGNIEKFMDEMNQFMREKGLKSTNFTNPHGLYHREHMTTAFEMAKLTQYAMQNPIFREVVKTVSYPRPETNKQPAMQFVQFNRLLKPGKYYYPKAIGVKTGSIALAGNCLVAAAEHEGRLLISVLFNCPTSDQRFKDTIALFEKAFSEVKTRRKLFTKEYDHFSKEIEGAERILEASLQEDLYVEYFPSEESNYKAVLDWSPCSFPIQQGQKVGVLKILDETGSTCKETSLLSKYPIKGKMTYQVMKGIKFWMKAHAVTVVSFFLFSIVVCAIFYILLKPKSRTKSF